MNQSIPETPEQKYNRIYKELFMLFQRENIPIHFVAELAQDLLISCAISAHHGNQLEAGESLRDHFIPEIAQKIATLLRNAYPVVAITERDTVLDAFNTTDMKPN